MKKIVYLIIAASFLLSSCEKENSSLRVLIEGFVMDTITTERIGDVSVELYTNGKSHVVKTNSNGYYRLGDFNIGDYNIVFSKTGYLNKSVALNLSSEITVNSYSYQIIKSDLIYLTPLNEKAEFTVYRKYLNGEEVAASDFPYTISFGPFNSPISGNTNSNGIITLDNAPRKITLCIDHVYNSIRYKTQTTIDARDDNKVVVLGYNPEANLGVVSTNVLNANGLPIETFKIGDNITILFTIPININNASFDLLKDGWSSVDFTSQWSNNNMSLTIDPATSLFSNNYYSLEINVKNESNTQTFSKVYNFTTE